MLQGSVLSTFRLSVWGLHTDSHCTFRFLHLVGVLVPAKRLKGMAQDVIYSP